MLALLFVLLLAAWDAGGAPRCQVCDPCQAAVARRWAEEFLTRGVRGFFLAGNGITLEGAVPSEQDSQPKPAKRARTSFTAEQLQVAGLGRGAAGAAAPRPHPHPLSPLPLLSPPGHAGTVRSGQQPRRTNASEAGGYDGAESESHSGEGQRNRAG